MPYYPPECDFTCGAACLRRAAAFDGIEATEEALVELCDTQPEVGTTVGGIARGAAQLGLRARLILEDSPIRDLERVVSEGLPSILTVDVGVTFSLPSPVTAM